MKYSLSDTPLTLREFGRNVQGLIDHAKTIEDRDQRNAVAKEIVRIMICLNPSLKDNPDYKQKLWDSLFIISDYELDIDAPYPVPPRPDEMVKEERMSYYQGKPKFRQYGWNVQLMINRAVEMEDGPIKDEYLNMIGNAMKQFLRNMDRESTPEAVIAEHMREMSRGKLSVQGDDLTIVKPTPPPSNYSNGHSKKGRGKRNNKRNNNNRRRKN